MYIVDLSEISSIYTATGAIEEPSIYIPLCIYIMKRKMFYKAWNSPNACTATYTRTHQHASHTCGKTDMYSLLKEYCLLINTYNYFNTMKIHCTIMNITDIIALLAVITCPIEGPLQKSPSQRVTQNKISCWLTHLVWFVGRMFSRRVALVIEKCIPSLQSLMYVTMLPAETPNRVTYVLVNILD